MASLVSSLSRHVLLLLHIYQGHGVSLAIPPMSPPCNAAIPPTSWGKHILPLSPHLLQARIPAQRNYLTLHTAMNPLQTCRGVGDSLCPHFPPRKPSRSENPILPWEEALPAPSPLLSKILGGVGHCPPVNLRSERIHKRVRRYVAGPSGGQGAPSPRADAGPG